MFSLMEREIILMKRTLILGCMDLKGSPTCFLNNFV